MGLISLFFLIVFTLVYANKTLENKPDFIAKATAKIDDNINQLAIWGTVYGFVAFICTPALSHGGDLLIRLLANLVIFLMALPLSLEHLLEKYSEKVNPIVARELRNLVGLITKNEKYVGYAGAGLGLILFLTLFR